jgi:hypothetical protein
MRILLADDEELVGEALADTLRGREISELARPRHTPLLARARNPLPTKRTL